LVCARTATDRKNRYGLPILYMYTQLLEYYFTNCFYFLTSCLTFSLTAACSGAKASMESPDILFCSLASSFSRYLRPNLWTDFKYAQEQVVNSLDGACCLLIRRLYKTDCRINVPM